MTVNTTIIMESVKVTNDYLKEWENLINELSEKELALIEWKQIYEIKAQTIEDETDFKAIYGRNNADIRKLHIKQELKEWDNNIVDLEISIAWITRRISFLRELVKCKRVLLEVKSK